LPQKKMKNGEVRSVDSRDVLTRTARTPDYVLRYGGGEYQVADLWVPRSAEGDPVLSRSAGPVSAAPVSAGRWPLVIFLHGGFWRSEFDRTYLGPLAEALAAGGFAVCTPEYRRTGISGGGWPQTFSDISDAVDLLPDLVWEATGGTADIGRVVLAGHSAGGHLALWAAASAGAVASGAVGVVSLAGVCDLAACYRLGLDGGAAADLMGGGPEQVPDRYRLADPMSLVPTGLAVRLVHGTEDDRVPSELSRAYALRAAAAGDDVRCELAPGYGHFAIIDPLSGLWPAVLAAFRSAAAGTGR
jgi:acetyl esterase/lipase